MVTAFKRIPKPFPFPMAKRAYCKQYVLVLLPIFAYVKSYEEEKKKLFFHFIAIYSIHPSAPVTLVKEKFVCRTVSMASSGCLMFTLCLAIRDAE